MSCSSTVGVNLITGTQKNWGEKPKSLEIYLAISSQLIQRDPQRKINPQYLLAKEHSCHAVNSSSLFLSYFFFLVGILVKGPVPKAGTSFGRNKAIENVWARQSLAGGSSPEKITLELELGPESHQLKPRVFLFSPPFPQTPFSLLHNYDWNWWSDNGHNPLTPWMQFLLATAPGKWFSLSLAPTARVDDAIRRSRKKKIIDSSWWNSHPHKLPFPTGFLFCSENYSPSRPPAKTWFITLYPEKWHFCFHPGLIICSPKTEGENITEYVL